MSDILSLVLPVALALLIFVMLPSCCFQLRQRTINRFKSPYDFQGQLAIHQRKSTSAYLFLFIDRFARPLSHFVKVKEIRPNTSNLLGELQITVPNSFEEFSNLQDTRQQIRAPLSLRASNYAEDVPQTPLSIKTYNRTDRVKGKQNKPSQFFRKLRSFQGTKHCFSPLAQNPMHTQSRENSFQEAKRAGPQMFEKEAPTPDALTPAASDSCSQASVQEEIECEAEGEERRMEGQLNLKLISSKSRNPKYVRVMELGQPIRSKSTFNNSSSFLENLQPPPTLRNQESEQSLPQKYIKPILRSSRGRMNSLPLTTSLRTDDSERTNSTPESYLFKPCISEISDKIKRRKFQSVIAKRVRSSSPVACFTSVHNEEFHKMLIQQMNEGNLNEGLLVQVRDQTSTAGTTPLLFHTQSSKPAPTEQLKRHDSTDNSRDQITEEYGGGILQKRESHLYFGRSPDIYRTSSSKLFPGVNSSQNLFKMENEGGLLGQIGSRQISNISSGLFGGQEPIERGRSRMRPDELISYPSNQGVELAQDFLKQLTPRSIKPTRPFDCSYYQESSLESKHETKVQSPVSQLYVNTQQSAYASVHDLKSIHESSEPDSRSYSRLSPKIASPTRKTHRISTFKTPNRVATSGKVEEIQKLEDDQRTRILNCSFIDPHSQIIVNVDPKKPEEEEFPLDVTDCQTLPYTLYTRREILADIIDSNLRNKRSYQNEECQNYELEELALRLKYGRYARDFTTALVKDKLGLFAEFRNPQLKHKYKCEIEDDLEEVRLELEVFGQTNRNQPPDPYTNKRFRQLNSDQQFLFQIGVNPLQDYKYLTSYKEFSQQIEHTDSQNLELNSEKVVEFMKIEKSKVARQWSESNLRALSPLRHSFSTSIASFNVVFTLLILKQLVAIFLVGMACYLLGQEWSSDEITGQDMMLSWAFMTTVSFIFGFFILQPLSLWLRLTAFRKCPSRLLNLADFKRYKNDQTLVQKYMERRLFGREELFALSDSAPKDCKAPVSLYKLLY